MERYDVVIVGGGPAGLAAALGARRAGAKTLLVEREARLGGILKQCIHDGFGLLRFGERLSGCEYAHRYIEMLRGCGAQTALLTFVSRIEKSGEGFVLTLVGREGMRKVEARALVLSTGCRERTARQVSIHGTRPAGVLTAGTAQHYINRMGEMPARRCVILGSGDIGLIMARRLTLEGAQVLGVYEAKPTPSGLSRNISQCLEDFGIPLYTSHTVTRVSGKERLERVTVAEVDARMRPIPGTEQELECDSLILSVGLIPENELAEALGVPLDARTKGPLCDQSYMTLVPGVFVCGNALRRPVPCDTVDGVKRRVRPGMGRCQGGFCGPLVTAIIAEEKGISLEQVRKSGAGSAQLLHPTKQREQKTGTEGGTEDGAL